MIGEYIVLRRNELGIKRKDLADELKISYNYLTLIETNKRKLNDKLKIRLAKALKLSEEEIDYYNNDIDNEYEQSIKITQKEINNIQKKLAKIETDKLMLEKEKSFLYEKLAMLQVASKKAKGEN